MATCQQCGRRFHYCASCGTDGHSEYDLCSDNCRLQRELSLSTSMTTDEALHIVQEMCGAIDVVVSPEESVAFRKLLLSPRYRQPPPDAG